jgi:hypothetical protein
MPALPQIFGKIKAHSKHVRLDLWYSIRQADNAKETNNVKRLVIFCVYTNTVSERQMKPIE